MVFGLAPKKPTPVYEDNEAAQALASKELMTKRSRFVDTRFHYTREQVIEGEIEVVRCKTSDMEADLFTKALPRELAQRHWSRLRGETSTPVATLGNVLIPMLNG